MPPPPAAVTPLPPPRYLFTEDLLVKPNADGTAFSQSTFEYQLLTDDDASQAYDHVPYNSHILSQDLQRLASRYRVSRLSVRLTRGRYDTSMYGPMPRRGFSPYSPAAPEDKALANSTSISGYASNPGFSVSALFHPCDASSYSYSCDDASTFSELLLALSPLVCSESPPPPPPSSSQLKGGALRPRSHYSSLSDPLHVLFPEKTSPPPSSAAGGDNWYHSRTPSSSICSENLSSFASLLSPCLHESVLRRPHVPLRPRPSLPPPTQHSSFPFLRSDRHLSADPARKVRIPFL